MIIMVHKLLYKKKKLGCLQSFVCIWMLVGRSEGAFAYDLVCAGYLECGQSETKKKKVQQIENKEKKKNLRRWCCAAVGSRWRMKDGLYFLSIFHYMHAELPGWWWRQRRCWHLSSRSWSRSRSRSWRGADFSFECQERSRPESRPQQRQHLLGYINRIVNMLPFPTGSQLI